MATRQSDPDNVLPWQVGDYVLAADGSLFQRTESELWPWGWGHADVSVSSSEGSVEELYPERPLTLLVRDGKAVGGIVVDDRALTGTVVRGEIQPI